MSAQLTVLLVDDHAVVREGYKRLLEESGRISLVAEASTAAQAYQRFRELSPDVVIMDIALPGVSGIEAMHRIRAHRASAIVLIFSMYEDAIFVRRAIEAGAAGYITKASAPRVLVEAVAAVASGRRFLSPDVAQTLALQQTNAQRSFPDALSAREFEILKLLVDGCTLAEVAQQLGLTTKTISNHQSSIKQKLRAETPGQLMRAAMRLGLLPTP